MEKKATNRKSKKEETPQVITTGIEEPALSKVSMLITTQIRGDRTYNGFSFFADENYAKAEMQKDVEKFKQAYLQDTYEIMIEEENKVVIFISSSLQLKWELHHDCTVEIEGKTNLNLPNRYNLIYNSIEKNNP